EEEWLPVRAQRGVVADIEAFERQGDGLRVLGECSCRAPMDATRELVEDDDEREPGARHAAPSVELAARRPFQQPRKPRDDVRVRATAEPPVHLTRDVRAIAPGLP